LAHFCFLSLRLTQFVLVTLKKRASRMTRYSLDISDSEKRQIESCRSDLSWKELSFGAKLRVLVFEQVEALERKNSKMADLNHAVNMAEMYAKACPGGIDGPLNGAVSTLWIRQRWLATA
jgi:hypothetical protein